MRIKLFWGQKSQFASFAGVENTGLFFRPARLLGFREAALGTFMLSFVLHKVPAGLANV